VIRFCRGCGEAFETDRDHHRYCWSCYWEQRDGGRWSTGDGRGGGRAESVTAPVELDERFLRDAIGLTHPDRHDPSRFKVANAVTATLLELLQRQRGRR